SSATAEDLPGAAFAGQQDTYLNVIGPDALLDAVRRCWGSLWTERAIAYRDRRDVDQAGVRIAVVVQRMIPSEFAGVMFTANPVTGARDEIVVDASSGLGEAVVSGLVTPDHYVLDTAGAVRERRAGRREVMVRGTAEGGVTHSSDEAHTELSDAVLAELAGLARAALDHFGRPQDIEWAYAQERVWLVQARPMTALPPPPIHLSRIQRLIGPQIVEMLPVRPYPMDMSAWIEPGIGLMVERMLAEIPGLRVDFADILPQVDGVVDRFVPPHPHPTRKVLSAPARNFGRIRRYRPAEWTRDPRFVDFHGTVGELTALDVRELEWARLRELPRRALAAMDLITDLRVDYLPRSGVDLIRLRLVTALLGRRSTLLTRGTHTRTEDANHALLALAEHVREDGALRAVFGLEPQPLAERIADDPAFDGFRARLDAFLAEYGHRETASPLLMSSPTWGRSPATVLGMIKVLVSDAPPTAPAGGTEEAEDRLLAHPLVRLTRSERRVRRLLAEARSGIAFREDSHFHGTRVLPALRHAVLEMG
ncbi:MAG: PEP/pyruvate-binding domain-containing protein, partial [Pseudonocardia sp.]